MLPQLYENFIWSQPFLLLSPDRELLIEKGRGGSISSIENAPSRASKTFPLIIAELDVH